MIIIRQKEYSSRTAKVLRAINKAKDAVMVPIDNAGLRAGNAIKAAITGKQTPSYMTTGFKRKTDRQINKETMRGLNDTKQKVTTAAKEIYYTPGQTLDKGLKLAAENPVTTATGVVGKVTMVTDTTGTGLIQWAPYKRMTDASGRVYQRTVSRAVRRIPSVPEMAIGAQNLGHMVGM